MRNLLLATALLTAIASTGCDNDGVDKGIYDINMEATPSNAGSVLPGPDSTYLGEQTITVEAEPAPTYVFHHWSGDIDTTANPLDLQMDQNYNLTAHFRKPFHLAEDGVTIICDKAEFGEIGRINGTTYTKRTKKGVSVDNAENSCTSGITNMENLFEDKENFTADISHWDVSNVTTMHGMFRYARSFNADLNQWDVGKVTDMSSMFTGASSFNGDIGGWDVSSVTDMNAMFEGAEAFNQNLNDWDVSSVTMMAWMFNSAGSFNGTVSEWDVSNVETMEAMFNKAESFNRDMSSWCVTNITSEPGYFDTGSGLEETHLPEWGTCPGN